MVYCRSGQREGTMETFCNQFHISDQGIQMQKCKYQSQSGSKSEWGKGLAVGQGIENKARDEIETHINATDNWSFFENAFSCFRPNPDFKTYSKNSKS